MLRPRESGISERSARLEFSGERNKEEDLHEEEEEKKEVSKPEQRNRGNSVISDSTGGLVSPAQQNEASAG